MSIKSITPGQCRAARAFLNIDQESLAVSANVSRNTVAFFERGARLPNLNNILAIVAALEAAGVEFIPENGGGAGVRLRK